MIHDCRKITLEKRETSKKKIPGKHLEFHKQMSIVLFYFSILFYEKKWRRAMIEAVHTSIVHEARIRANSVDDTMHFQQ